MFEQLAEQGPKLTTTENVGQFGGSVALSSDGNTALIGAAEVCDTPSGCGHYGAAWVFTRSASTWTQQGPKLTGSGEVPCTASDACLGPFGTSVALSSDGNTALVAALGDNKGVGSGLGIHPLSLGLDPAGLEAHGGRGGRRRALRQERGAVA